MDSKELRRRLEEKGIEVIKVEEVADRKAIRFNIEGGITVYRYLPDSYFSWSVCQPGSDMGECVSTLPTLLKAIRQTVVNLWVLGYLPFDKSMDTGTGEPVTTSLRKSYIGVGTYRARKSVKVVSFAEAKLFDTGPEAARFAAIERIQDVTYVRLRFVDMKFRQKLDLRRRALSLFSLPLSTPFCVVADRYEEEGMIQEARVLRF